MKKEFIVSRALFCIVILALLYNPIQKAHAQPRYTKINKSAFTEFFGEDREMVLFVHSSESCPRCRMLTHDARDSLEQKGIRAVSILMLDRLKDSLAFMDDPGSDMFVYVTRDSLANRCQNLHEDSWYYYHMDSSMLAVGSILTTGSMNEMMKLCESDKKKKLRQYLLSTLDESKSPMIMPRYNGSIRDSILLVGSDKELSLKAFDVTTGSMVWATTFADTLFRVALKEGEQIEKSRFPLTQAIMEAESCGKDSVVFVGRIVGRKYDSTRKSPMLGKRFFIAMMNTETGSLLWVKTPRELNSVIATTSLHFSELRYPYLYTSRLSWTIPDDEVYSAQTVMRTNLENGQIEQYAIMDSVYKILSIGENISNGLFCIISDDIWTAQPLSHYLKNEGTGERIYLSGRWYIDYMNKMKQLAESTVAFSGSTFQRYKQYPIECILTGLYNLGEDYIAVTTLRGSHEHEKSDYLSVYDIKTGNLSDEIEVKPGVTLQGEDATILRIERDGEIYQVVKYQYR